MKPDEAAKAIRAGVKQKLDGDRRAILEAAHFGVEVIAGNAPVDVGTLKASAHVEGGVEAPRIVIDAPHMAAVELGSRPHTPPLQPLIDWVKRHRKSFGITGKGTVRNKGTGRFEASPEIVAAARAIQAKIAREGTKPTFFVRGSLPKIVEGLARFMGEAQQKGRRT